ncbi:hypothetical protein ZYGM_000964 [Zygosaccharomyces mellis]|uniref:Golgi pH regulator n=1 Tax=Zygosaccharomyces mellis TaxID=42258 RepID=A0A4C2E714_9SACH|nr:hypothetical protein ZYGM_000964 [Zygosaccharomyces mellis]
MEDVFMVIVLISSSLLTYHWSYGKLWFLVDSLFEAMVTPSSTRGIEKVPKLEIDDNHFLYKLYANYSLSSTKILKAIRIIFSMAIVSYVITIEIVLWQIKNADIKQQANFISTWIWPFVSSVLSVLLILVQPFFALMMLLNKSFDDKLDIDSLIIVTSVTLLVIITTLNFTTIGPFKYTENILTKLSILGITVMAMLSSIASISTLYYTYIMIKSRIKGSVTNDSRKVFNDINTGTLLWYTDDMVTEKMEEYQKHIDETIKILNRLDKEDSDKESPMRTRLMDKIGWYQLELGQLESRLREPKFVQILKKMFQFSFLFYCFQKVVMSFTKRIPLIITDVIRGRQYGQLEENSLGADPLVITISSILDVIFFRFSYQHDLDALTRQISLIISTSLFACSFSTVATTISYMIALLPTRFRILVMYAIHSGGGPSELPQFKKEGRGSQHYKSPSIIKNLFVSELSGIYVVATILTIRSNLPFAVSQKVNELLGQRFTVPNVVIDSWFEIIYGVFCILTLIGIKAAEWTLLE